MTPSTHPQPPRASTAPNKSVGEAVEYDLFRLDCAVDALRGQDLAPHRDELRRIADNLTSLMETVQ